MSKDEMTVEQCAIAEIGMALFGIAALDELAQKRPATAFLIGRLRAQLSEAKPRKVA